MGRGHRTRPDHQLVVFRDRAVSQAQSNPGPDRPRAESCAGAAVVRLPRRREPAGDHRTGWDGTGVLTATVAARRPPRGASSVAAAADAAGAGDLRSWKVVRK